jgi:three-Cys-motif partner protein
MKKCAEGLEKMDKDVHFKALYLEKDSKTFDKLQSFLDSKKSGKVETHCLKGEFAELRDEVLEWCGEKDFTFFFIDPTGWKDVAIPTLRPLLQRPNSELLINFMYDFLVRAHTQSRHNTDMIEIFGEVPDTSGMTPKDRESYLLRLYRSNLKSVLPSKGQPPRSVCVKVLDPVKDRTKYSLVYLTRHAKGIVVFMEASEKLDPIQKEVRANAKEDKRIEATGQTELALSYGTIKNSLHPVKEYWLEKLSTTERRYGIIDLADMLEDTGWFPGDFQRAFKELEKENKVENLDATRVRPVNAVNFSNNERLRKLIR